MPTTPSSPKRRLRIDPDIVAALRIYASKNGRTWKSKLRKDWESSSYPSCPELAAELQLARKQLGPSGLVDF